jgi:hypothetical protein
LWAKYISAANPRPKIKRRFKIFPTPKYLRIRKRTRHKAIINPLLVFVKITANVKSSARKTMRKKIVIIPGIFGSIKYKIPAVSNQKAIMTISVGKKFFLLVTFCFLFFLTVLITYFNSMYE